MTSKNRLFSPQKSFIFRSVLLPELKAKALTGTPKQAKYAVYCISKFTSVSQVPLLKVCKKKIDPKGLIWPEFFKLSEMKSVFSKVWDNIDRSSLEFTVASEIGII